MSLRAADPVREMTFLLHEVLRISDRGDLPGYAEATPELTTPVLEGMLAFAADWLEPLDAVADAQGCVFADGMVTTPPGFRDAYRAFCAGGWAGIGCPERFGGFELPSVVTQAAREILASANPTFALYPGLTRAALGTIARSADPWLRDIVVPKMVSGEWTGTMCLTEAHCGTDLKLMRTRATPQFDGSYLIDGTKIFISGGDHDLADNIIHLVLAKIPGADGRIGDDLSQVALFLVPKHGFDHFGTPLGIANGVVTGGIEDKMGFKGSATCTLNFEGAIGWRVGGGDGATGSKSAGMRGMFDMMNQARLGTGVQALAVAAAAYAKSLAYARDRRSGKAIDPTRRTDASADPIIEHPDVRRMLFKQAAFIEGGRALALWVALQLDIAALDPDPAAATRAGQLGSLMTPVIKAFFSDRGFESSNLAVQIFGGHGYIRANHVERHARDGRIFQLYEGANGIQALDLVTRKLPASGGAGMAALLDRMTHVADAAGAWPELAVQTVALREGVDTLQRALDLLQACASDPEAAAAAATDVLAIFGIVSIGFMWTWMGTVAAQSLAAGHGDAQFHRRKLLLGAYWAEREMPAAAAALVAAKAGSRTLMALPSDLI